MHYSTILFSLHVVDHMQLTFPVYTSDLGFAEQHKQAQSFQIATIRVNSTRSAALLIC